MKERSHCGSCCALEYRLQILGPGLEFLPACYFIPTISRQDQGIQTKKLNGHSKSQAYTICILYICYKLIVKI